MEAEGPATEGVAQLPDLDEILDTLPPRQIGVVGDFCLDFYQFVDLSTSETSLETGLATLPVREVRYSLGGAGNVVNNLCAMGARSVRCFGVVGDDPHGMLLIRLLERAGARVDGLLVEQNGWLTQTYTKVMVDGRENPRIDWGNFNALGEETGARLIAAIREALGSLDLLVINQQLLGGIHTNVLRRELASIASSDGSPPCIVDSRSYSDEFPGAIRKLNDHEGARLCGRHDEPNTPVDSGAAREIAALLYERWQKPLLLTRGERGCLVCDDEGICEIPGIATGRRVDTVGAGDSMLAGAAAALAAGKELRQAARLGNLVAGVTVQKLNQTGTASPEEIRTLAARASYRFRTELAESPHLAKYHPGTRIEIVTAPPAGRRFAYAIFDNDGTLSTLRQGWEEVMEPMMVRSILGNSQAGRDEKSHRAVVERVHEYIDETTGVQTLVQMHGLAEMVREFGFVAEAEVLSPADYKDRYNGELMRRVGERIRRLERRELDPEDFLIKRSVEFVSSLLERGVKVYLASGTDHADVLREARALGYAPLFGDAIYGAVGDVHHDPKEQVIETILSEIGYEGDAHGPRASGAGGPSMGAGIITFGDGPVEIRLTSRRGGYTVGVASCEQRRFDLNPTKRKRLIEAGADLIIPDFTEMAALDRLLLPGVNPRGMS